jgi:hypothetical protein
MPLWRIRITMSDDPHSQELLTAVLAEQRVWALLVSPRDTGITGDVVIELPDGDGIGGMLGELRMISPRVFVTSVDSPPPAVARPRPDRAAVAVAAVQ